MPRRPSSKTSKSTFAAVSIFEWLLAGVASSAVLLLFTYLSYVALTSPEGHPILELEGMQSTGSGPVYFEVAVSNAGQGAAADVEIEGAARTAAGEEIIGHVTLDYAPAQSTRIVTLVFPSTDGLEALKLRVTGFREP